MSTSGLALRRITGHCTVTADRVTAWYRLAPQGWSFRPDTVREQLIIDAADALAQLDQADPAPAGHHPPLPGLPLGAGPRRQRPRPAPGMGAST